MEIKNTIVLLYIICLMIPSIGRSQNLVRADDSRIQYYGRWDMTNPVAPSHSWPGVYIYAEFEGSSIGARFNDNFNYYNVIIDGEPAGIFHGTSAGTADYELVSGLDDGQHSILLTKRNEAGWANFSFHGFILDEEKDLLEPAERPERSIEFIGDSFTSASGNEATTTGAPSEVEKYTNVYEGFGPIIARHYGAQYHMTSVSGIGLVLDWQGNFTNNLPDKFDRTNIQSSEPAWDFEQWIPNLVVIGLGLNDYSGFGGWEGTLVREETDLYKSRYHEFIAVIRDVYPGVKILAVATHVEWMRETIEEIVEEENAAGNEDVYYAQYSYYEGGYVNDGHPNVATHYGIAEELIAYIDSINAWEPYNDTTPPVITSLPESPFISYDSDFEISVTTDSYSTVKYDYTEKTFDEMQYTFNITGRRNHVLNFSGEHGREYTLFVKASDIKNNVTPESSVISFSIDTTKVLLNWYNHDYDAAGWNSGSALFGQAGFTGINTAIEDANTVYFRKSILINNPDDISAFGLLIKGSDAAAVYLNGTEIGRINFPDNDELDYNTYALQNTRLNKMFVITDSSIVDLIKTGSNCIAIEMHKAEIESDGVSFDSQMINQNNQVIYSLGSEWFYFDSGYKPGVQLVDKTTDYKNKITIPVNYFLYQNYPNPFNPSTTIKYTVIKSGIVTLSIFNSLGELIQKPVDGYKNAGEYTVDFNGSALSSGVYFYTLSINDYQIVRQMLLLK